MLVEKRNGQKVPVSFDAISERIRRLCQERGLATDEEKGVINVELLAQKTISAFPSSKDRILKTSEIDALSAEIAEFMTLEYGYSYHKLAGYLLISNLQKETPNRFSVAVQALHDSDPQFLAPSYVAFVAQHAEALDAMIQDARDFKYDYFGFQTLRGQKSGYLLRDIHGRPLERPQYMHMRVAIVLSDGQLETIARNYDVFSELAYTHATPTLLNAGKRDGNLASCFLLEIPDDSLTGITDTLVEAAQISKKAGGIGISVAKVRARDSIIRSSRGKADGIPPMLKGFDWVASYVNQAGARKGAVAIYLPPWHADIFDFLDLKTNEGDEAGKCRNLFQGLWIPDLFMKRVDADQHWSLFSPDDTPELAELWGTEFEEMYVAYEKAGKARKTVKAQVLWFAILKTQMETGGPYMLYADSCNAKSNQKNIGMIKSSNLCVHGDTPLLTRKGLFRIATLQNTNVEVWNGKQWSLVTVKKTSSSAKMRKIEFSDWGELVCTDQHRFFIGGKEPKEVLAQDLRANDLLCKFTLPNGVVPAPVRVTNITPDFAVGPTYCFSEPLEGKGVFNGYLTGNCSEILEVVNDKEIANCNLASLSLPYFVRPDENGVLCFDFADFRAVCHIVVENLNRVIDQTDYPTWKCKNSNLRHRPLGIGVQGLADVFMMLKMPYSSPEAMELNTRIFEHMYFACLSASVDLARKEGHYQTYPGSPLAHGILQPDFWNFTDFSAELDWTALRQALMQWGARNSLLISLMPTASTSSIMGNIESFEPLTTNVYNRRTQNGEYYLLNRHLAQELERRQLWKPEIFQDILRCKGSVKQIAALPIDVRKVYRTCWEISAPALVQLAAGRAPFICQSQSFNCFIAEPTFEKLTAYHFYAWRNGLKTGMYYLRTKPVSEAQNVVVTAPAATSCRINDPTCQSCSA